MNLEFKLQNGTVETLVGVFQLRKLGKLVYECKVIVREGLNEKIYTHRLTNVEQVRFL